MAKEKHWRKESCGNPSNPLLFFSTVFTSREHLSCTYLVHTCSAAHFFGPLAGARTPSSSFSATRQRIHEEQNLFAAQFLFLVSCSRILVPHFQLYQYWLPSFKSPVLVPQFWLPSSGFPSSAAATEHWWMAVGRLPGIQLEAVSELLGRRDAAPPPALQIMALSVRTK